MQHRIRRRIARLAPRFLLAAWAACAWLPVAADALPTLHFIKFNDKVKAKNVTAGGDVMFFSVSGERQGWTRRIVHRLDFRVANGKGVAADTGVNVVDSSIWTVYDFAAGTFAVDSPIGETHAFKIDEQELVQPSGFNYPGERLELVVVRGSDAWHQRVYDGGNADRSVASDGQVEVAFDTLSWVFPADGGEQPPAYGEPRRGDVVIGIDPAAMVYFVVKITGGKS